MYQYYIVRTRDAGYIPHENMGFFREAEDSPIYSVRLQDSMVKGGQYSNDNWRFIVDSYAQKANVKEALIMKRALQKKGIIGQQ
jgi:hypothetical protein